MREFVILIIYRWGWGECVFLQGKWPSQLNLKSKASHRLFKSWPVQQDLAKIQTVCGQAECTKWTDQLGFNQPAGFTCYYSR